MYQLLLEIVANSSDGNFASRTKVEKSRFGFEFTLEMPGQEGATFQYNDEKFVEAMEDPHGFIGPAQAPSTVEILGSQ
jgi:hypothetical protein